MRNEQTKETQNMKMSEETIQGEHRKLLFQKLRDICGCLTTEDDCDEIARVVFESYPTNEKMSEEKLNALSQVPILRDERFNIGYIAKWCGEDVASDEINCNQDHDQLMKNGHSDCWTCGEVFDKQINWQAKYERLNLSLAKNKRLFSDEYSQSVIESQVKRIKRLEDDLSRANCELDKLRKETK